jgi:signal peptide peptidase SppA
MPDKLAVLTELAQLRASGRRLSDEQIADRLSALDQSDRIDAADVASKTRAGGAVAVIPIHGTIAYRADSFDASSGGTSTERIGAYLDRAVNDEDVRSILLDFNTPGGTADGVPELAARIMAAADVKPVVALVNSLSASAGYWLASAAGSIEIIPSGAAGSIGVFTMHVDITKALENEGVKVTAISAGDNKLERAPFTPLSEDAQAHIQGQVDDVYRQFVADVARGRGVAPSDVKKNFGQGRVYQAKEAMARGMVDRIATPDQTIARMMSGRLTQGPRDRNKALIFVLDGEHGFEAATVQPAVPAVDVAPPAPTVAAPAVDALAAADAENLAVLL